MLKNSRTSFGNDCSCCHSRRERRAIKHGIKQSESRQWLADISDEKASFELESEMYDFEDSSNWWIDIWGCFDLYDSHVYDGGRCVYCNSDIYDNIIYGDDGCVPDRELMVYTVESTP